MFVFLQYVNVSRCAFRLLDAGFSASEIFQAVQDTDNERHQRELSLEQLRREQSCLAGQVKLKLERAVGKRGRCNQLSKIGPRTAL